MIGTYGAARMSVAMAPPPSAKASSLRRGALVGVYANDAGAPVNTFAADAGTGATTESAGPFANTFTSPVVGIAAGAALLGLGYVLYRALG